MYLIRGQVTTNIDGDFFIRIALNSNILCL